VWNQWGDLPRISDRRALGACDVTMDGRQKSQNPVEICAAGRTVFNPQSRTILKVDSSYSCGDFEYDAEIDNNRWFDTIQPSPMTL
jgi:hypothetical protein